MNQRGKKQRDGIEINHFLSLDCDKNNEGEKFFWRGPHKKLLSPHGEICVGEGFIFC